MSLEMVSADLTKIDYGRMFRIQEGTDGRWCVVTNILGMLVDPVTLRAARAESPASGLSKSRASQLCMALESWYGHPCVSRTEERKARH